MSLYRNSRTLISGSTFTSWDNTLLCDTSLGGFTLTLPHVTTGNILPGYRVLVVDSTSSFFANNLTIETSSGDSSTILGATSVVFNRNDQKFYIELLEDFTWQLSFFAPNTIPYTGLLYSPVVNPTTPYTPGVNEVILWDCTAGPKVVNLPAAATSSGYVLNIKKTDVTANTLTIDGDGTETIDGGLTAVLTTQYESISIFCNGTEWFIIASY